MERVQFSKRSATFPSCDNSVLVIDWQEGLVLPHGTSMVQVVFRDLAENLWIDYCIKEPVTLRASLMNSTSRIVAVAFCAL